MFHVVLFQPEIPPNTGNIIRLCANSGTVLHLIHPLGFRFDDKQLQRAGLDYHEWARVLHHKDYPTFLSEVAPKRLFACSTRGTQCYADIQYQDGDVFLFGAETRGLPLSILSDLALTSTVRIPMLSNSRSLNLANSVAIVVYESLRQLRFLGMTT